MPAVLVDTSLVAAAAAVALTIVVAFVVWGVTRGLRTVTTGGTPVAADRGWYAARARSRAQGGTDPSIGSGAGPA